MTEILQVVGAILVLAPFMLAQFSVLSQESYPYLLLNLLGSSLLAALGGRQWGFLMLEGAWAIVSLWGVIRHGRRGKAAVSL